MKKLLPLLSVLFLIFGCSSIEPINYEKSLIERDGIFYTKDTNIPYSGPVFSLNVNGLKKKEGYLKDGKMISFIGFEWYENGLRRSEINYTDGKKNGPGTWWYKDGKKSYEGIYKDGNPIDGWTYYQRDGTTIEPIVFSGKVIYKDGLFVSKDTEIPYSGRVLTVYDNGQKEWEVTYKDGVEDGLVNQWYNNGQKQLEVTFKNKKPDGIFQRWNEDGYLKE